MSPNPLLLSHAAFQQSGHPSLPALPQDSGRLAAVRPLTMPEPPPLISSSKPGGSITQVYIDKSKNWKQSIFLVNHPWELYGSCSSGNSGAVAQSRSRLRPREDALNSDGAAMDGSEESGWVESLRGTDTLHFIPHPSITLSHFSHALFFGLILFHWNTLYSRSFPCGEAGTVVSPQFIVPSRQPVHAGRASRQCRWTR